MIIHNYKKVGLTMFFLNEVMLNSDRQFPLISFFPKSSMNIITAKYVPASWKFSQNAIKARASVRPF